MRDREPRSRTAEIGGATLHFHQCRILPDTALVLRDVVREADRLWRQAIGTDLYDELRADAEGDEFFTGRVRLESVPPEREMLAVWMPFPAGFRERIKPQLIDYVEIP